MKAPNKIYLHGYPDKPFLCQDWDVAPTKRVVRGQQAENIAYIRKDALLEWAKEKKQQLLEQESVNDEPSDVAAGMNAGFDMIIGKLNSI